MTFEQYRTILLKRWKLVVICFILVGLGALMGSELMKPLYQSSALVQVVIRSSSSNQADYNNLLASDQLVQTEAALSTSNPVLREVVSHYPSLTTDQLIGEVSTSTKTNTQLFEIDVVDASATRAASLANDIAATLIKQQLQLIQQTNTQGQQQIQQDLNSTGQQIDSTTLQVGQLQAQENALLNAQQQAEVQAQNLKQVFTPDPNQLKQEADVHAQIAVLQTQLKRLQNKYDQRQSALVQLELSQAQSGDNTLRLVQPAQVSSSAVSPNKVLYTAGGLAVGLLLGMLLALLFESLDTRVRTPVELTQLLDWPVLATIWQVGSSNQADLVNPAGNNINAEPYRILRTNIGLSSLDKPLHSLLVTSALPHDGKSINAANLAIFMAKAGKNTLLVDADLRNPAQHILFNLSPNSLGLSNAALDFSTPNVPRTPSYHQFAASTSSLQSQDGHGPALSHLSLQPFVHAVGVPNLWVMPSGPLPPSPSEFLESKAMQRLLGVIANCGIEVVIFDTPPLLGLSDASILASKVDAALVIVDVTHATRDKLKQMKAVLSQTGVQVLGCVANKLRHRRNDSAYYYYQNAEAEESNDKATRNGHMPSIPTTPILVELSSEQKYRSN